MNVYVCSVCPGLSRRAVRERRDARLSRRPRGSSQLGESAARRCRWDLRARTPRAEDHQLSKRDDLMVPSPRLHAFTGPGGRYGSARTVLVATLPGPARSDAVRRTDDEDLRGSRDEGGRRWGGEDWGFDAGRRRTPRLPTAAGTIPCCVFAMAVASFIAGRADGREGLG